MHVVWSDKMIKEYDTSRLSSLHVVFKADSSMWRREYYVSLYKCLDEYLKEESLGLENSWLVVLYQFKFFQHYYFELHSSKLNYKMSFFLPYSYTWRIG